jgi:hypothetical protein
MTLLDHVCLAVERLKRTAEQVKQLERQIRPASQAQVCHTAQLLVASCNDPVQLLLHSILSLFYHVLQLLHVCWCGLAGGRAAGCCAFG